RLIPSESSFEWKNPTMYEPGSSPSMRYEPVESVVALDRRYAESRCICTTAPGSGRPVRLSITTPVTTVCADTAWLAKNVRHASEAIPRCLKAILVNANG